MPVEKKEKKPIVKRAPKTIKEKKFVKEYVATGNGTQAALKAYDATYDSARKIGSQMVAKLDMEQYFIAAGFTDEAITQNIARIAFTSKKQNQFTGEIDSDDAMQLKATELGIRIMGKFAPPRAPVDGNGETVIPILGMLDVQRNDGDL